MDSILWEIKAKKNLFFKDLFLNDMHGCVCLCFCACMPYVCKPQKMLRSLEAGVTDSHEPSNMGVGN